MTRTVLAILVVLIWLASPAAATTFYVSTAGSDANSCATAQSDTTPKRTIGSGKGCLAAGDTLIIRGGTYVEEITWYGGPTGTSWSAPITVRAQTGETVTVRPSAGANFALSMRASGSNTGDAPHHIAFAGTIIFDGSNASYDVVKITAWDPTESSIFGALVADGPAHHIRFTGTRFTSTRNLGHFQQGVHFTWGSVGLELLNCEIDNVGDNNVPPNSQGVYGAASDALIDGCHIHDVDGFGISNLSSRPGQHVDNHIIRNNRVHAVGKSSSQLGGINIGEGTGHLIYNNLVYSTLGRGIAIAFENSTATGVYNNTVYGNPTGIYIDGGQTGTIIRNNISYNNSTNYLNEGSGTVEDHNLFGVNPQFVSTSIPDFHLLSTSPAKDTGITVASVPLDVDGDARPQNMVYDMGYDEYLAAAPPPVPPVSTPLYRLRFRRITWDLWLLPVALGIGVHRLRRRP